MHRKTPHARFRTAAAGAAALSLLLTPGIAESAEGGGSAVTIATVGGQAVTDGRVADPLSGQVTVNGTADVQAAAAQQQLPVVADARDSAFVARGERAVLLGSAYGGKAPYTFLWSTEHGKLSEPKSSSTEVDTKGLGTGRYDVTLTVTDAAGKSTSDTVAVVVFQADEVSLFEDT